MITIVCQAIYQAIAEQRASPVPIKRMNIMWHVTAILTAAAIFAGAAHPSSAATSETIVQTRNGALQGARAGDVLVWRGVPYAAPPVGALRWRPPQPVHNWDGVRAATKFGNSCPQAAVTPTQLAPLEPLGEDCLSLNIWAPRAHVSDKLPVMVWLHGGGFIAGAGSEAGFDGTKLAQRGIILVTLNYRLGRLGFFAHPALSQEYPDEPHGNYGFMDQIAALRWVHDNISAFGGDPENVTLFGESAGAASALSLATSPLADGLFEKMIVQSTPVGFGMRALSEDRPGQPSAETAGYQWAVSKGIKGKDEAALAALRALPVDEIAPSAPDAEEAMAIFLSGGPIVDGKLLPRPPAATYAEGSAHPRPMIIGTNSEEGNIWSFEHGKAGLTPIALTTDADTLSHIRDTATRKKLRARYLAEASGDSHKANAMIVSDTLMGVDALRIAQAAARKAPVYLYRFDAVPAQVRSIATGSPHGTDIFYVFDNLDRFPFHPDSASAGDQLIAHSMADYWAGFARTGTPKAADAPDWPQFDAESPVVLKVADDDISVTPAGAVKLHSRIKTPDAN